MPRRGYLNRLLFPPRCASCRVLLPFDAEGGDTVFCPDCRGDWEREKLRKCPECGRAMIDCICMPDNLRNAGCAGLFRLTEYDSVNFYGTVNSVVNNLKRSNNKDDFNFFAEQIACALKIKLSKYAISPEEVIVTYAPRSRSARSDYGFDQSELLSREVALLIGGEHRRLIKRKFRLLDRRQKTLGAYGREMNARRALSASKISESIKGRDVVVVDDVITTGATTSVCVEILRLMGARAVFCACISTSASMKN